MASFKKEMVSGVFYTAVAKYSGVIIQLGIAAILARLLTEDDFGIVAIATVIIAFFSIFSDLGIAPAIVQKKDLADEDLNNIFTFTTWSGIVLSLLFFFSSELISSFYETDELIVICKLLSINLLFASINIVPNALLLKAKRFKFIAIRTLSVQIICGIIAVLAALYGAGLYALLVNPILSSIILFFINYSQNRLKIRLNTGISSLKKIFSYSAYQLGFNIINYFSRNLDKLLIGKYISKGQLGFYEKSYRFMMLPLQYITNVVTPVMHPIFSEYQNDTRQIADNYLKVIKPLAFIGFPLSVLLWFTSSELILIVFGEHWIPSVPVFRILTISVWAQIIMSTSGSIFQAANATKTMFWCGVISTAMNIGAICTGIFCFGTIEAVAWGITISFIFNFLICYGMLYGITLKVSWAPFWKTFISPVIMSVILCASLMATDYLLADNIGRLISLIIKCSISLIIFIAYIQLTGAYDIRRLFKKVTKKES